MIQRRQDFGLALEASEPLGIGRHAGGQDLDRDLPLQPRIGRAVDLAHPAGAERSDDAVRAEERSLC